MSTPREVLKEYKRDLMKVVTKNKNLLKKRMKRSYISQLPKEEEDTESETST
jgi:hypothetical protein